MLCRDLGDRWLVWYLIADEVEGDVQNAGLFHFLFGQFVNLVISNNVCVISNFVDGDFVMGVFNVLLLFGL